MKRFLRSDTFLGVLSVTFAISLWLGLSYLDSINWRFMPIPSIPKAYAAFGTLDFDSFGHIRVYSLPFTGDSTRYLRANGMVSRIDILPTAGSLPTAGYDVSITHRSLDILMGHGANLYPVNLFFLPLPADDTPYLKIAPTPVVYDASLPAESTATDIYISITGTGGGSGTLNIYFDDRPQG